MTMPAQQFASDNYAGICPEAWAAMAQANHGSAPAYGDDDWTQKAADAFRTLFDSRCEVFFVFNGTAANSLALASLCQSYHSVICAASAHVETDECGAPEFFSNGSKLLVANSEDGKLTPEAIYMIAQSRKDIHFPKPRVVTITQPTETGQVYSIDEIRAISAACRDLGLKLHMDGARFAHACAALGCDPADISWRAGVDVLCMGGTKGGMAVGEAVIFFDTDLAQDFDYRCKQAGQLASKMRFLAAPWLGILSGGAWLHTLAMPIVARRHLRNPLPICRASTCFTPFRSMRCSCGSTLSSWSDYALWDGSSTPSSVVRRASCSRGTRTSIP